MPYTIFYVPNHRPHIDIHTLFTEAEAMLPMADPGSAFTDVACDAGRWNLLGVVPLPDITSGLYMTNTKRINYLSQLSSLSAPCFNDILRTANILKHIRNFGSDKVK
jgi:hypothetical protein